MTMWFRRSIPRPGNVRASRGLGSPVSPRYGRNHGRDRGLCRASADGPVAWPSTGQRDCNESDLRNVTELIQR